MHILVKTITGVSCEISNVTSVNEVQTAVESQMGVPTSEQKLLYNGAKLSEATLLSEYGITSLATLSLIIALEGGAKGKKKKKDTKKNKKPHKKTKVNLAILKYYKVDEDKVVRLRQMCKVCPPGTFLANHYDRLNCGRCRTLFKKTVIDAKPKEAPKKVVEKPKEEKKPEKGGKGKKK